MAEDRPGEDRGLRVARMVRLLIGLYDGRYESLTYFHTGRIEWVGGWPQETDRQFAARIAARIAAELNDLVDVCFTEPNVAFTLLHRDQTHRVLAVHFSLEALPPWLQGDARPDIFSYAVTLTLTPDELSRAVAQWRQELRAFPVR